MNAHGNEIAEVARVAADLTERPVAELERGILEHAEATAIVNALEGIRVRKGLRQKDVAERMKVSESTVSRFEDSRDEDLRVGDLVKYAGAVGMKLTLFMEDPSLPAAEQIKHCVFIISDLLQKLTDLAKKHHDDPAIVNGINAFRSEVLFNFFTQYLKSEERVRTVFTNSPQGTEPLRQEAATV